jgi:DNA-binding response OmpR family regulator
VDDEAAVRAVLHDILTDLGFHVGVAADGNEALALMPVFQPEVVLLDVLMPGPSGDEVLERLRREHPRVPVVIVTAYRDAHFARVMLARGAVDYVRKPFDLTVLERVVSAAIQRSRSQDT